MLWRWRMLEKSFQRFLYLPLTWYQTSEVNTSQGWEMPRCNHLSLLWCCFPHLASSISTRWHCIFSLKWTADTVHLISFLSFTITFLNRWHSYICVPLSLKIYFCISHWKKKWILQEADWQSDLFFKNISPRGGPHGSGHQTRSYKKTLYPH